MSIHPVLRDEKYFLRIDSDKLKGDLEVTEKDISDLYVSLRNFCFGKTTPSYRLAIENMVLSQTLGDLRLGTVDDILSGKSKDRLAKLISYSDKLREDEIHQQIKDAIAEHIKKP